LGCDDNNTYENQIYDGINKYVSLLNSFCTHAKSLHLSELFPSFLIQVPGLTRSPPPAAPTKPVRSDKAPKEWFGVARNYGKDLKEYIIHTKMHQTVVLPPELEAFLKYY